MSWQNGSDPNRVGSGRKDEVTKVTDTEPYLLQQNYESTPTASVPLSIGRLRPSRRPCCAPNVSSSDFVPLSDLLLAPVDGESWQMAARLHQLRSKAAQASEFVAKNGCAYYKELLEKNKQYIVQPPSVEKCQELSKQLFYTRLASIPGRYESFWKEINGLRHIWRNKKDLKVEEASIAALFGLELYAWSCVGEIVGRGFTFTGYYV